MTDTSATTIAVLQDGSHDLFAHYAEKAEIVKALVEGVPIIALCGKIWVPSRDPEGLQICPKCKEVYEQLSQ